MRRVLGGVKAPPQERLHRAWGVGPLWQQESIHHGVSHIPPFLSPGTDEEESENLLKTSKVAQPGAACPMGHGKGIRAKED